MSDAKPNVATMTASQLSVYIDSLDARHKLLMKELRALLRVRQAMEDQD